MIRRVGIDVDTKRELYKHLREFANEGNSVVYMSSELEEFIGFCSRVVVFRNGSIFDTFVDDEVEPVGILEGMFGRTRAGRVSGASVSSLDEAAHGNVTPPQRGETERPSTELRPLTADDVTRVKVVDFDELDQRQETDRNNMKISYFD